MKALQSYHRFIWMLGALLAFPTAYLITASLLKYGFGISALFDGIEAPLERWGAKEPLGWNINLLILFGPILAALLNVGSVLELRLHNEEDRFEINASIKKFGPNLITAGLSCLLLFILFVYMIGENCR